MAMKLEILRRNEQKRDQYSMTDLFSWLLVQYAELVAAVRFLSILPLPDPPQHFETEGGRTASSRLIAGSGYFPLVGLLLALLSSLLLLLLAPLLPHLAV